MFNVSFILYFGAVLNSDSNLITPIEDVAGSEAEKSEQV